MFRWEDNIKMYDKDCELQATYEHGNELLESAKDTEFLDRPKSLQLLKRHYTARSYLL